MEKRDKEEMSRRKFLKIVGVSAAASAAALYGCASEGKPASSEASVLGEVPVDKMTYRVSPKGERVYLAGIGLSIGDSLLYGMTAISYITWCTAIQAGQAQDMLAQLAAEEVTTTYETVSALFTTPSVLWLLLGVNCILDMVLNIALMNVIFGVIKGNLAKWWYGVTAAVTFFAMISFQLYNQESIASIAVSFAVKLVIFAVTIYYTFRVAGKEIEYSDD